MDKFFNHKEEYEAAKASVMKYSHVRLNMRKLLEANDFIDVEALTTALCGKFSLDEEMYHLIREVEITNVMDHINTRKKNNE